MEMEMPPPTQMPPKRATKRVLPPVPVEKAPQAERTDQSAVAAPQPTDSSSAAASTLSAPVTHHQPTSAGGSGVTPHVNVAPPTVYTLPLWSAAPQHDWSLSVLKDGSLVESIPLKGKSHFLIGRQPDICDIVLDHASISRRHAVLQFHENGTLHIYDLGTAHGTFRNKKQLQPNTFVQLDVGDMIKFAASTRTYIIEGPEELRPKEIDREAIRQRNAKLREQYEASRAEQEAAGSSTAVAAASVDSGASWGQSEDAHDSDDEAEGQMLVLQEDGTTGPAGASSSGPLKLTKQQQKWQTKIDAKQEKLQHLAQEVETLRSKDIRQGGLTPGQENQIARNEERMKVLSEEVANLEQLMRENVERVAEDREKGLNTTGKKRKSNDEDDEDYASEDDDFYDRTKNKPHVQQSSASATTANADAQSILATLTPIAQLQSPEIISTELKKIEGKRDQLRLTLQEVVLSEAKSKRVASSTDSLDSFMSNINTSALEARKSKLKGQLQELQAHYVKLQRLSEQKKGELLTKRYMEGDKDAFKNAAAAATASSTSTSTAASYVPHPMDIDESKSAVTPVIGPSSMPPPPPSVPASAVGLGGTAEALARMKRKQEAAARKLAEQQEKLEKIEEMKRAIEAASKPATSVKPFSHEPDTKPKDRYALLAQQLEAARGAVHRNYDSLPEDDVSRALKAAAQRSVASMSVGLKGNEERGGLHVRKREGQDDGDDRAAKRAKYATTQDPNAPRIVGPTGPMDEGLQRAQEESSVEWVAPVTAAAGQDKLRAKFAGRY